MSPLPQGTRPPAPLAPPRQLCVRPLGPAGTGGGRGPAPQPQPQPARSPGGRSPGRGAAAAALLGRRPAPWPGTAATRPGPGPGSAAAGAERGVSPSVSLRLPPPTGLSAPCGKVASSPTRGLKARGPVVNIGSATVPAGRAGAPAGGLVRPRGRPGARLPLSHSQQHPGFSGSNATSTFLCLSSPQCRQGPGSSLKGTCLFPSSSSPPSWWASRRDRKAEACPWAPPAWEHTHRRGRIHSGGCEVQVQAAVGAQEAGVRTRRPARRSLASLTMRHHTQTREAPLLVGKEEQQGACPPV